MVTNFKSKEQKWLYNIFDLCGVLTLSSVRSGKTEYLLAYIEAQRLEKDPGRLLNFT